MGCVTSDQLTYCSCLACLHELSLPDLRGLVGPSPSMRLDFSILILFVRVGEWGGRALIQVHNYTTRTRDEAAAAETAASSRLVARLPACPSPVDRGARRRAASSVQSAEGAIAHLVGRPAQKLQPSSQTASLSRRLLTAYSTATAVCLQLTHSTDQIRWGRAGASYGSLPLQSTSQSSSKPSPSRYSATYTTTSPPAFLPGALPQPQDRSALTARTPFARAFHQSPLSRVSPTRLWCIQQPLTLSCQPLL